MNEKRWWEYYLVRYLLGAIVGAICIIKYNIFQYFGTEANSLPHPYRFIAIGIGGFAICYIASIPILIFHAARHYISSERSLRWILLGAIAITVLGLFINADAAYFSISAIITIAMYASAILIAIKNSEIASEYKSLASKRKLESSEETKQFVESYRHLREHGNGIFAALLTFIVIHVYISPNQWMKNNADYLIAIWLLPGVVIWFLAARLEREI